MKNLGIIIAATTAMGSEAVVPTLRSIEAIDLIIIHASATKAGKDFSSADIERWHLEQGFISIGYHFVIRLDGTVEAGRPIEQVGAHCKGWNANSIGICYIGGLDRQGHPADTRTEAQKRAMRELVSRLQIVYGIRKVIGHSDVANKACPCFDVKAWLRGGMMLLLAVCLLAACGTRKSALKSDFKEEVQRTEVTIGDSSLLETARRRREELSNVYDEQTVWTYTVDTTTANGTRLVQVVQHRTGSVKRQTEEQESDESVHRTVTTTGQEEAIIRRREQQTDSTKRTSPKRWGWLLLLLLSGAVIYRCRTKRKMG